MQQDSTINLGTLFSKALSTLISGPGGTPTEQGYTQMVNSFFNLNNLGIFDLLSSGGMVSSKPQASLNYMLYDEQMTMVQSASGRIQVNGDGAWSVIGTDGELEIPRNGYLVIFLGNMSSHPVMFDNLFISFRKGKLIEETHYYPHGLPMGEPTVSAGSVENRYKHQGNEYNKELGLNWMDFGFRQYDPQIGRFLSVDPLADYYGQDRYSPYAAMGNQPESMVDPNGLAPRGNEVVTHSSGLTIPGVEYPSIDDGMAGSWREVEGSSDISMGGATSDEYAALGIFMEDVMSDAADFAFNDNSGNNTPATGTPNTGDNQQGDGEKEKGSDFDHFGKRAKTAAGMFFQWLTGGLGMSTYNTFDGGEIAESFRNAKGVELALDYYYNKYSDVESFGCLIGSKVTDYDVKFGIKEFFQAGFDPIEQFVGTYKVDIVFRPIVNSSKGYLEISIRNTTSMTSAFYHMFPSYDSGGPMSNAHQLYKFNVEIDYSKFKNIK